jgi:hypothetical protein
MNKPKFKEKVFQYYIQAIGYLNGLLDNDNLKSITVWDVRIDNSIRVVVELKR